MCNTTMVLGSKSQVFPSLKLALRRVMSEEPEDGLDQIGPDVWWTDDYIRMHTDDNKGLLTFGMILMNDRDLRLFTEDCWWSLKPGTVYCLDGSKPHGAFPQGPYGGQARNLYDQRRFAFLAWDISLEKAEIEFRSANRYFQLLAFREKALADLQKRDYKNYVQDAL